MKVIDLLNKIVNGEEAPKKIKYRERIFDYDDIDYFNTDIGYLFERYTLLEILNDEIEILEDKKIDKLNILDSGWHKFLNETENYDLELNKKEYEIVKKINEIIEVINGRDN